MLFSVLSIWFYASLPNCLFKTPYTTVLYDQNSNLLGAKIARDGQWRFPTSDSLPKKYKKCLIKYEDAYFYKHPGVNPISLIKALYADIVAGKIVRGGSTISMQVIRMSRGNRSRNVYQKLIEIILALRLELSYNKDDILNLYASHAPFGGNVVGLEAASWRYYGRNPFQLSWGETATLAVLPNAPSLIYPGKNHKMLLRKRNALLDKLLTEKIIDSVTCDLAKEEPLPNKPKSLPQLAPHLLDLAIKQGHEGERIYSTIDINLQKLLGQIALRYYKYLSANQINNMAILVNKVENGQIIGYLGNVPSSAKPKNAAVDMIMASRSTGSILKPFLYAWAYQDGLILPNSLLKDIPTQIAGYHPKNYNKTYDGAVPASEALARSLNIPAVRLLRRYGLQKFRDKLQLLKLPTINKSADYYGLTLILGGAETRLFDMANTYSMMSRVLNHYNKSGAYDSEDYFSINYLRQKHNFKPKSQTDIFGAGNIWFVYKALSDKDRPDEGNIWNLYKSAQKIAWKTGTSFGHRDAWCIGTTQKYTVSVWVGNATGEGRPEMTGTQTAAPIMFDVFKHLPASDWFDQPNNDLSQVKICLKSGMLASPNCPDVKLTWAPKYAERSRVCHYHKRVHLNQSGTKRVNSSCYKVDLMQTKTYFVLPPIQAWYYKKRHASYIDLPPWDSHCQAMEEQPIGLIYPKKNVRIFIPKDFGQIQQKIVCKAVHQDKNAVIYWHLDQSFLKTTKIKHQIEIFVPPGKHILRLIDGKGHMLDCPFEVVE